MDQGKVFMTHQTYDGSVERRSSRQFDLFASQKLQGRLLRCDGGGSLLAAGFNASWCEALNRQRAGEDIRWFAMLHSDVVPQDWWLDTLIEDMIESGADLMSAVIPIKDPMGRTSTAIDDPTDRFNVERTLSTTEAANLPMVFGAPDCGYPDRMLLANTGCWVCDFTKPWRHAKNEDGSLKVLFTINDRIIEKDGKFVPEVEPEDWFFSRAIGALGAKVMCTRRVQLHHVGKLWFPNNKGWGQPYDKGYGDKFGHKPIEGVVRRSPLASQKLADVEGWLNDEEGMTLARLAQGKRVLEIGSYCGRSTIWMAAVAEIVYAVDPFDSRDTPNPKHTLDTFKDNLARYELTNKVQVCQGTSEEIVPGLTGLFDLIFIDGAHDYESVKRDIALGLDRLRPGGFLAFHDYDEPTDPGVSQAVDEILGDGAELMELTGSVAVVRPAHLPARL